jgi:hypothetical protein
VSLRGSYPHTRLRIITYDRPRDLEQPYEAPLWSDQEFVEASRTIDGLKRWIGDFLMYRRGG